MKALIVLVFCAACAPTKVGLPEVTRSVSVRVVAEHEIDPRKAMDYARDFLRTAGVAVSWVEEGGDIQVGIKKKSFWQYLIGLEGLAWYTDNRVLVWAGWSDLYTGRVLAHEIAHCLGATHGVRGVMHQPWTTSWVLPGVSGFDLANGFSNASIEEINNVPQM